MHWHEEMTKHADKDSNFLSLWLASFVNFLPTYGFGLALVTGLALYTRFRNSELQRAALEREWSAARLSALRMQLSPHTLFNLLHTIRGLHRMGPEGRAGHGRAARGSVAPAVERRGARFLAPRR